MTPFALSGNAKKWFYSIPIDSITSGKNSWQFVSKSTSPPTRRLKFIIQLINSIKELEKLLEVLGMVHRFSTIVFPSCNRKVVVVPDGVWKTQLHFQNFSWIYMSRKMYEEKWGWRNFLEDLAWKIMQWENPVEKSNVLTSKNKNSFHIVDSSIATKTKLPAFMPRMELLEVSSTPLVSQVYQM